MSSSSIATIVLAVLGALLWSIAVFADLSGLTYGILASLGTLCFIGAFALGPFRWLWRLIARWTTKIDPR